MYQKKSSLAIFHNRQFGGHDFGDKYLLISRLDQKSGADRENMPIYLMEEKYEDILLGNARGLMKKLAQRLEAYGNIICWWQSWLEVDNCN